MGHYVHASKPISATGQLQNQDGQDLGRCAVQSLWIVVDDSGGTPPAQGSIVMRDGGPTGPVVLELPVLAYSGSLDPEFPQRGLLFSTNVHVTLTDIASLVVYYEG